MYGSGCYRRDTHRLSALFAKKYNAKDINMAKDGGNNDRSVRKIVDWAIQNKDKLDETIFLLGLSSPERYDLWDEQQGCYAGGSYDEDRPDDPIIGTSLLGKVMGVTAILGTLALLGSKGR